MSYHKSTPHSVSGLSGYAIMRLFSLTAKFMSQSYLDFDADVKHHDDFAYIGMYSAH